MNLLICVGENYRDFAPLNQYVQNIARNHFGIVHQMLFCDSVDEALDMRNAKQCLIAMPQQDFSQFVTLMQAQTKIECKSIEEFVMFVSSDKCNIWLVDLLKAQNLAHLKPTSIKQSLLYLYPLGIDATSVKMLLSGIAKDFGVSVCVLNADSNLEILSATNGDLQNFKREVEGTFGDKIFSTFHLEQSIIALLESKNLKLATAESCTGGLIAYSLTKQSGASNVFDGGVISYANAIKEAWLGVSAENLSQFGAVSEAVVREMLNGALKLSGADFALATSGVAGPSGGSASKPVGTVYIGAKSVDGAEIIERLYFKGNRNYIQEQAVLYAQLLFLKIFLKNY
ncbi:CinA family protein [Helicobacter sp. MIT 11-5569]|uniref:CinA family protein n=1 Tax=Helicobacter sp. MIT 11-5569 TaxID=1548151 RepID=UPI00051FA874|nr:CinA family protein [Helicobacter sp. MIT 11-5569]TLD82645.1 CinA family protein [Helicobacter sp. MIT 11-5569]